MLSDVLLVNPTLFPWIATRRAWRLRTKPRANVILGADQGHCSGAVLIIEHVSISNTKLLSVAGLYFKQRLPLQMSDYQIRISCRSMLCERAALNFEAAPHSVFQVFRLGTPAPLHLLLPDTQHQLAEQHPACTRRQTRALPKPRPSQPP
jgi:hypothetical protein